MAMRTATETKTKSKTEIIKKTKLTFSTQPPTTNVRPILETPPAKLSEEEIDIVSDNASLPQKSFKFKLNSHWVPPAFFFCFVHMFCPYMIYKAGYHPELLKYSYAIYAMMMFGALGVYHRYFSHRGYKTSRVFQFVLALVGLTSGQGGPLYWATHHRWHHRHCELEEDVHSPIDIRNKFAHLGPVISNTLGFIWAQGAYLLIRGAPGIQGFRLVPDWVRFPELVALQKVSSLIFFSVTSAIYYSYGLVAYAYYVALPLYTSFNCVQLVNSAAHMIGEAKYVSNESGDCSAHNIWWLSPIMFGANWHSNHHAQPNVGREGFEWYEIDMIYYVLKIFELFGLVWDIKQPKRELLVLNPKLYPKASHAVKKE